MNAMREQQTAELAGGDAASPEHTDERLSFAATEDSPLVHYLSIIRRRIGLILGIIGIAALISLYSTMTTIPLYRATAQIQIEREAARVVKQNDSTPETPRAGAEFYQTQYGLISSRAVAEGTVRKLRLADSATFLTGYSGADAEPVMRRSRPARSEMAVRIVLANTSVDPVRNSGLVNIRFASPDPQLAARVANTIAETYIETNLQRRFDANGYARTFLENELQRVRGALEQSEQAVVNYADRQNIIELNRRTEQDGTTVQGQSIPEQSLDSLNNALAAARTARIAAEARARSNTASVANSDGAIQSLNGQRAQLQAEYNRNLATFRPEYPTMVAMRRQIESLDQSIRQQTGRITQGLQAELRTAREQEQSLEQQVSGLEAGVQDLGRRRIQYNIYQRDADTNRALYNSLLERYKEIGVAGGIGTNNVSIVDTALPPGAPFTPRTLMNLLLAIVAGATVGIALAFLLEQLDGAIKTPADIERTLGVPVLGIIPALDFDNVVEELSDRKSDLAESYLSVQTSLRFSTAHGVPATLSVTSANESEGKSTTALAIASTLARMGRRTLLIDGDMRNPSVHRLISADRDRGFADLLAGGDLASANIVNVGNDGLKALSAGPNPPNPSELLGTNRANDVIAALAQQFDHIVIDSPPVIGLADAPLIAAVVEATVFVIASGDTGTKSAIASLRRLHDVSANVIGTVLTRYSQRNAGYSYNYNYSYRYGDNSKASLLNRIGISTKRWQ